MAVMSQISLNLSQICLKSVSNHYQGYIYSLEQSCFCLTLWLVHGVVQSSKACDNSGQVACAMQQLHLIARETVLNQTLGHTMCVCKGS